MVKLLELYNELENTNCPFEDEIDKNTDWCEVCKNNTATNGYYDICNRIERRIEAVKERNRIFENIKEL